MSMTVTTATIEIRFTEMRSENNRKSIHWYSKLLSLHSMRMFDQYHGRGKEDQLNDVWLHPFIV